MSNENNDPPPGYSVWGNHGDGLWRAAPPGSPQDNCIDPCLHRQEAIDRAWSHYRMRTGSDERPRSSSSVAPTREQVEYLAQEVAQRVNRKLSIAARHIQFRVFLTRSLMEVYGMVKHKAEATARTCLDLVDLRDKDGY